MPPRIPGRARPGDADPVRYDPHRFSRYARELEKAVHAMRFRITEPTFFWGKHRQPGEIMEAPTGPYRNFATGGGLQRIPQFIEMPDENAQAIQHIAANNAQPIVQQATQQSTAAPLAVPQVTIKAAPKANPLAARIRALTTRRAKFQDEAASILDPAETAMTQIESDGPMILKKVSNAATD